MSRTNNYGTVAYATKAAGTAYVDRLGATRASVKIENVWKYSDVINVGATGQLAITVSGKVTGCGSVTIALLTQRTDGSGLTWRYAPVAIAPADASGIPGSTFAVAPANLVGPDSAACDFVLLTTNQALSGNCKVAYLAGAGVVGADDAIQIAVSAA